MSRSGPRPSLLVHHWIILGLHVAGAILALGYALGVGSIDDPVSALAGLIGIAIVVVWTLGIIGAWLVGRYLLTSDWLRTFVATIGPGVALLVAAIGAWLLI